MISSTELKKSNTNRSSVFLPYFGAERFKRDRAWTHKTLANFLSTYMAQSFG
ncbi:Uncharacterised protein [Vibrio cholerae]|nr:Uncharacterised protein [Vibrio cholerae]